MAKRKIASITIRPAKNGGHTVRHEFEPAAEHRKGMNGGMFMTAPPTEEHTFGPKEHAPMMRHLADALALKGLMQGAQQQAQQGSPVASAAQPQDQEQEV